MNYPYQQKTNNASKESRIIDNQNIVAIEGDIKSIESTANTAKTVANTAKETANSALSKADNAQKQVNTLVTKAGESSPQVLQALTNSDGETFGTLKEVLDDKDQKIKAKADTEYVDTQVSAVASGSPKGTYATLVALQTAFPTGATGIYVVSADGKWYYWTGNMWTAGGVYQSSGIASRSVTPEKTTYWDYKEGKNLYNPNSENIVMDSTLNKSGTLSTNTTYKVTDFIEVPEGKQLQGSYSDGTNRVTTGIFRFIAVYDANGNILSAEGQDAASIYYRNNVSSGKKRVRFSINKSYADVQIEVVDIGGSPSPYEAYKRTYYIPTVQTQIDTVNVDLNEIKANEYTFGKNRFNPNDTDILSDYYMNKSGILSLNSTYKVTGYIEVDEGKQLQGSYLLDGNRVSTSIFRFITVFDKNKTVLPSEGQDVASIYYRNNITPGKKYVRFTLNKSFTDVQIEQVDIGGSPSPYEAYEKVLYVKKLQTQIDSLGTDGGGSNDTSETVELLLPNNIYVPKNTTLELYDKQICKCGNINNFHFRYTCSVGKTLKRKFIVDGSVSTSGTYTLKVEVLDNNFNLVTQKTVNLVVLGKGAAITTPKKLLNIGDSLSNGKQWLQEILTLSSNLYGSTILENVGTLGASPKKHEGRSGYTAANYTSNTADGWNGNVKVLCTLTNIPISKKQYTTTLSSGEIGLFEVEEYTGGYLFLNRISGQGNVNANGVLTGVDSGVVGDSPINYTTVTVTSFNPFWNPTANQVDFTYYTTNTGITPDIVQLFLGTNDLFNDLTTYITNMQTLVSKIKAAWNVPVMVVLPPYRADQNGIGNQNGNKTKFDIDNLTFAQNKKLIETFEVMSGVYVVPVAQTMDSEYNYGANSMRVNYRNTATTMTVPVESVHPQDSGYLQFADAMFGVILKIIQ